MLHGRGSECAAIDSLLDDARRSRSGSLLLRGEPGVGKSALLTYAVERASDMRVLRAVGVETESGLPFAGLHQLLRTVLEHLAAIPELQAAALRGALRLEPTQGPGRFLIALAVLSLLSDVCEERPVLCVVDDVQWLDPETVDALRFVARRVDAEGIALILAATEPVADLPEIIVVGLDRLASDALLIERTGMTPAPHIRAFLWESTRGSPFALIEIASALGVERLEGRVPLPEDLRLGVALQDTLLARTSGLPDATRTVLLIAAAEGTGDIGLVLRAAATLGIDGGSLEPAELAGLVLVDEGGIAFRDPLLRTAVYQGAPFGRRQAAHRALAENLTADQDADRRTWHQAAAAVGPDDVVADELEGSAERTRLRGGHAAASSALERAADLSSRSTEAGRRLTAAASEAWLAGRGLRARGLLDRAEPLVSDPVVWAEGEYLRGLVRSAFGDRRIAFDTLLSASERPGLEPASLARFLVEAGRIAWSDADLPSLIEVGQRMEALDLPESTPESFAVRVMIGMRRLLQGDAATAASLIRSSVSNADREDPQQLQIAGAASMFTGDDEIARELLTRAIARARALGAMSRLPQALAPLASLEVWEGGFLMARIHASEGVELARETGQEHLAAHFLAVLAWIAAVQGRTEECEVHAKDAFDLASAHRVRPPVAIAMWALALLDIGMGRWSEAFVHLKGVTAPNSPESHPMVAILATPDLVEAASRLERLDLAHDALTRLDAFARSTTAAWMLAVAARCRALLSDDETASGFFEEALGQHAKSKRRFDEARTHLVYGEFLRRARRRADARVHLRSAIATFELLGASPWEERARTELRATGETARKREPSTLRDLTPQQTQIARLVAEGATNKEVAAQLFLSPRTVDYHLRNVFAKLGITSRSELILLAGREGDRVLRDL